ncbi:hypothetical protein VTH06DRAFT_4933 [Thermothelomyces fergusii]
MSTGLQTAAGDPYAVDMHRACIYFVACSKWTARIADNPMTWLWDPNEARTVTGVHPPSPPNQTCLSDKPAHLSAPCVICTPLSPTESEREPVS